MSGLEVQAALRERGEYIPIIFLSAYGTIPISNTAHQAGAFSFLEKGEPASRIAAEVVKALESDRAGRKEHGEERELRRRVATLTSRQHEVFELIGEGLLYKQIASKLGIKRNTVKVHKSRIARVLGVSTLPELAAAHQRVKLTTKRAFGDGWPRRSSESGIS